VSVEPDEEGLAKPFMSEVIRVPIDRHDDESEPGQFDFTFRLSNRQDR